METAMINIEIPPEKSDHREGSIHAQEPKYYHGLNLYLNDEVLIKLGIDVDDLDIGDEIIVTAKSFIQSKSSNINENREGKSTANQNMSLQITDVQIAKPEMHLAFELDDNEDDFEDMFESRKALKLKRKQLQLRDLRRAIRK